MQIFSLRINTRKILKYEFKEFYRIISKSSVRKRPLRKIFGEKKRKRTHRLIAPARLGSVGPGLVVGRRPRNEMPRSYLAGGVAGALARALLGRGHSWRGGGAPLGAVHSLDAAERLRLQRRRPVGRRLLDPGPGGAVMGAYVEQHADIEHHRHP